MNDVQEMVQKTPIEIALGVDDEGMCTARKLYEFLELAQGQFSRWVKTNILENEFATENEDFWGFDMNVEGNIVKDYRLTANFAKKLSMRGNSKKSEQAREYFTTVEERMKKEVLDHSHLSPHTKMLLGLAEGIAKMEIEQNRQAERLEKVEQAQEAIKVAITPIRDNWREEVNKKFNRIQHNCGADFKNLRVEMYNELDSRAGTDIKTRLRNRRDRMKLEGSTKSAIDKLNLMDVIEDDKKLREIFAKIVSEYEVRYCT